MVMKDFFKVTDLEEVLSLAATVPAVESELVPLDTALDRVLAETVFADDDLPPFPRSTMDGFAVRAADTFGASEGNPAYLKVTGSIPMGDAPSMVLRAGEAAHISTGGMLPGGADAVVMVEHTELLDDETLEVYKSMAPGQHVIAAGEDFKRETPLVSRGYRLRPQELGLLSAFGKGRVRVFRRPVVGIISTGDEIVSIDQEPRGAQIRDINTHTLSGFVRASAACPRSYGIVKDDFQTLLETAEAALAETDMLLLSGGSSVGTRDLTIQVLESLPDTRVMVHGISISPGKPTIMARSGKKIVWGLPGHVVSAMIVYHVVVRPFVEKLGGKAADARRWPSLKATLTRNIASAQGRVDYVRVRLSEGENALTAEPVLGKSALINTMVRADGLIAVDKDLEGLDKGAEVAVIPI